MTTNSNENGVKIRIFVTAIVGFIMCFQGSLSAREVDHEYSFEFTPLASSHQTRLLIDSYHATIFRGGRPGQQDLAIVDIAARDGFQVEFLREPFTKKSLGAQSTVLLIAGLRKRSPMLTDSELTTLTHWLREGGSMLLIVGHSPNGRGALSLMDALGVQYEDGYGHTQGFPGEKENEFCSHYEFNRDNGLLVSHPITQTPIGNRVIKNILFFCGTGIRRNSGEVIFYLPKNTEIWHRVGGDLVSVSQANDYAGMLAFEYGLGRVVVISDQGVFRHLIKRFRGEKVGVTMNNPAGQNAELFVNSIRWLAKLIK